MIIVESSSAPPYTDTSESTSSPNLDVVPSKSQYRVVIPINEVTFDLLITSSKRKELQVTPNKHSLQMTFADFKVDAKLLVSC